MKNQLRQLLCLMPRLLAFTATLTFTVQGGATAAHTSAARAHKFYASLAQLDYNEETKSLEVALRIFADDLELALTKRQGHAVYLDKTPNVAKAIRAYLQDRFEVRGRDGKVKELKWVGMEAQVDSAWLYFEIPVAEGLDGAQLRNRILLEQYPEQVNTTILKTGGKQRDFIFKIGDDDWRALIETMK